MCEIQITDPEQKRVLWECLMQQRELDAAEDPPEWQYWARLQLEEVREHGPAYRFRDWFGDASELVRQRHRRAIFSLEAAGLLTTHRRTEKRLSNIKLTPAGLKIAVELDAALGTDAAA